MTQFPTWEDMMIPIINVMKDGVTRHRSEIYLLLADQLRLTPEQRQVRQEKSGGIVYKERCGFALSFLQNVNALDRPTRGQYVITDAGRQTLEKFPLTVNEKQLRSWAEDATSPLRPYVAKRSAEKPTEETITEPIALTPGEQIRAGVDRIQEQVAADLLRRLQKQDPGFFESAVVDLLLAMGYGGTGGRGQVTQISHDGGIDGVIDQDVLGLSKIYVQAKRYADDNVVQKPGVQTFVGALSGKADAGVFITTSRFSPGALRYVAEIPTRIILIDGDRLTDLMMQFGVGVQVQETLNILAIDEDFFA